METNMEFNLDLFDKLFIKDLLIRCIVGINPEERNNLQDIIINIILYCDLSNACVSDDIQETVNYKSIKLAVIQMVESSSFFLIEKLAEEIGKICLADPHVRCVRVRLEKPGALRFAKTVGIEILRQRHL